MELLILLFWLFLPGLRIIPAIALAMLANIQTEWYLRLLFLLPLVTTSFCLYNFNKIKWHFPEEVEPWLGV